MTATWSTVLDEFERRIISGRNSLAAGEPLEPFVLEPFVPPAEIGQLPLDLVDRAVSLLEQNRQLEHDLSQAMSLVSAELAKSNDSARRARSAFTESSTPRHFDGTV